jgi:hypothetical protein
MAMSGCNVLQMIESNGEAIQGVAGGRQNREGDSIYYGRSREYPPPTSELAKWIRVPRGFC